MTQLPLRALILGLPALALASCSTMKTVGHATASGFSKVGSATASGFSKAGSGISNSLAKAETFSLSDLMPSRVKVVEVREQDLKPMKSGHELAAAHTEKKRGSFWNVFTGREYKEPKLPNQPEELDGTLLPPL